MNQFQIAYSLALLIIAVPAWKRQRYAFACLVGNLVAMLALSLALDLGLNGSTARLGMMTVDLVSGVALAVRPGLPRVIAAGYALTVPLYAPMINGLFTRGNADFTLVYAVAALQIGALVIGSLDSSSGGLRRRLSSGRLSMAAQKGDRRLLPGSISCNAGERK